MTLPNKPTDFRTQQLAEPWTEGEMFAPLQLRGHEPGLTTFTTTVKNAAGTFEPDPEYFKTVFLGGEGKWKEEAAVKERWVAEK